LGKCQDELFLDMGPFCGDVGLFCGDLGFFFGNIEFCANVGTVSKLFVLQAVCVVAGVRAINHCNSKELYITATELHVSATEPATE